MTTKQILTLDRLHVEMPNGYQWPLADTDDRLFCCTDSGDTLRIDTDGNVHVYEQGAVPGLVPA